MSSVSRALRALLAMVGLLAVAALLAACGETQDDQPEGGSAAQETPASGGVDPNAPIKEGMKTVSIPKQLGNPYEEFEHSGVDEALKELYGEAGVDFSKDTIANCRIGERSAHTWFVLHELLDSPRVKNYDGSWTEYGSLVGVPVAVGDGSEERA